MLIKTAKIKLQKSLPAGRQENYTAKSKNF